MILMTLPHLKIEGLFNGRIIEGRNLFGYPVSEHKHHLKSDIMRKS